MALTPSQNPFETKRTQHQWQDTHVVDVTLSQKVAFALAFLQLLEELALKKKRFNPVKLRK
jgi:hypothetical protein